MWLLLTGVWQKLDHHTKINGNERRTKRIPCCYRSVAQSCLFVTPWTIACQASLSFIISQCLLKLMSIESVMPSNHLGLCRPLLLLPSIFPSIRGFSNESALCFRWSKSWRFSIGPSDKYSGLITFRKSEIRLVTELLQVERIHLVSLKPHIQERSQMVCIKFCLRFNSGLWLRFNSGNVPCRVLRLLNDTSRRKRLVA